MIDRLIRGSAAAVFVRASFIIFAIAIADWQVNANIPLGFLYLFPMVLVGGLLNRWQIGLVALFCTLLTEAFDNFVWVAGTGIPRDILIFAAFFGIGSFVFEVNRNRRSANAYLNNIESEIKARREAEDQLKNLVESSPVAVVMADAEGTVLLANDAAHRLFHLSPAALPGRSITQFLPSLLNVPEPDDTHQSFRTVMQCRGRTEDGEVFLADVWFSTYRTTRGSRLSAMVLDTSEELRSREQMGLHQLLAGSRILAGAVSHEVRNVCGAIAVVHANLARNETLANSKDFEALGTLVLALKNIAAVELRQTADQVTKVDLKSLLEELRIVVEAALREEDISTFWNIDPGLPEVWADRQSLMQVLLNLVKNSESAMRNSLRRELVVSAIARGSQVLVRVRDSGSGVAFPDRLFRPFQQEAEATGLGLYISRAMARSFRGDLRYLPEAVGSSFIVELTACVHEEETDGHRDTHFAGGRSQPVSGKPQPIARG